MKVLWPVGMKLIISGGIRQTHYDHFSRAYWQLQNANLISPHHSRAKVPLAK
jgi:hypothetical protein